MTRLVARHAGSKAKAAGWLLICGIVLASLTEAVASTALALGRADIAGDTHATPDEIAWLDISYIASKLTGFAVAPWLVTRIQPRDALLFATLGIGAACAASAITSDIEPLVLLRAAQGFAGAILLVTGQAMLFWSYLQSRQPILQALFAMGAVLAPATLVPALQGWLLDSHSWTWIFLTVAPVALAAAALILLADPAPMRLNNRPDFDWAGLALLSAVFLGSTYVLSQGSRWDWFESSRIVWLSAASGLGLVLFVLRPTFTGASTLLDLSVFKVDDFAFAFIVSFAAGAALFGSAFLIPAFAVLVLGFTPTAAGQLLLPSGALFAGALLLAAYLIQVRRIPPIATVPFGILLIMTAMWMLSGSNGESGVDDMMLAILLRGLGLGFLFLAITLIAFCRLPLGNLASGIAIFNIGRQLGGLIGIAGLQTVIERQAAANQAVLGAAVNPGSPALADRIASTTSVLVERGMETSVAVRAAARVLGRSLGHQATLIAFDTAFSLLALLFVVAAPVLILVKILLARAARQRGLAVDEVQS